MKNLVSYAEFERITLGNPQMMKDLLLVFVKQNQTNASELEKNQAAQNHEVVKALAHKIGSSFALAGMQEHKTMAEELERSDATSSEIPKLVAAVCAGLKQAVQEIEVKLKEFA